jgi:hypothetical protein
MTCGHHAHFRGLLGGLINDLCDAEFVTHARYETKMI